jgi:hypothetical protein
MTIKGEEQKQTQIPFGNDNQKWQTRTNKGKKQKQQQVLRPFDVAQGEG